MFILVHLLSVGIFDICFQWDSKLKNIQVYLFWCSATLQPFKIWFVVSCLLLCNSVPTCKYSLQRSDADFPHCRRLVCVGRVSKQELSRNFSVSFFRLNMKDFQIMSDFSSIASRENVLVLWVFLYVLSRKFRFQKILFHWQLFSFFLYHWCLEAWSSHSGISARP